MTTLQAVKRTEFTNSAKRKIRESGEIPAIIYGKSIESKPVAVNSIELMKTLREEGKNTIINLSVDGSSYAVMLYDLQTNPLKSEIVHADFHIVDMQADIQVEVPINLTGDAQGVKDGGVLQQPLYEVTINVKPGKIPQTIEVDITNLGVNETISIKDLPENKDYTFVQDEEQVIASILPPKQEAEIDSGEEQEAGTPQNEEGREKNEE
ncbi:MULTISPECIES: 50S ribosomal protein L25/general stress protein Ctc [Metabacillus]|jgi:large subunit ribosomal protein L25|uniref:Large ribosomal subunit protein bL25 n=1 Tax=Metabacillus rhizolycopersici TaxID=2875709 RepID=A0ABS7USZ8_9BACI|nr:MULTISPECIES: 50S ribosomal protein L25/general stress protein Ctc [Metabacillus]MBZ5751169.1 50S ribosomal protein L25/general stress protein Ctc [Metabacillus rhizolycopersici]MCM3655036.1 50S ribosomal protein L25/general stress protein Ctc [Metabacillus litoralis]